jgi:hypothetical protein
MNTNVILGVTFVAVAVVAVVIRILCQRIHELEAIVAADLAALKECDRAMTAMALEIYGKQVLEQALRNAKLKGTN